MIDIIIIASIRNEGLGRKRSKYYNNSNGKDRRNMVVTEVREIEEGTMLIHIGRLAKHRDDPKKAPQR